MPRRVGCGADGVCRHATGVFDNHPGFFLSSNAVVVDVDGDGISDLVDSRADGTSVFRGTGTLVYADPEVASAPGQTGASAVGQLDDSGGADLATPFALGLSVAVSVADGGFRVLPAAAPLPDADVVLVSIGVDTATLEPRTNLAVAILGDGDGLSFSVNGDAPVPAPDLAGVDLSGIRGVPTGDIDHLLGPPFVDELVLAFSGDPIVRVYSFSLPGAPTLRAEIDVSAFGSISGDRSDPPDGVGQVALVADWDSDGNRDVVVRMNTGAVVVARGNGAGGFEAPILDARLAPLGFPLAAADFDGDGTTDLVGSRGVFIADGGDFVRTTRPSGTEWHRAALADFNGDADVDLIATTEMTEAIEIGLSDGAGRFSLVSVDGFASKVAVGDFDGDFVADAAFATIQRSDASAFPEGVVSVVFGARDGGPPPPVVMFGTGPAAVRSLIAGRDLGLDAPLDDLTDDFAVTFDTPQAKQLSFVASTVDRQVVSGFALRGDGEDAVRVPERVFVGDFAGDDAPELVVFTDLATAPALLVLATDGDGHILAPTGADPAVDLQSLLGTFDIGCAVWHTADVDGDGTLELVGIDGAAFVTLDCGVSSTPRDSRLVVIDIPGDLRPTRTLRADVPKSLTHPISIGSADIDADGQLDLVISYFGSLSENNGLGIYFGNAGTFDVTAVAIVAPPPAQPGEEETAGFGFGNLDDDPEDEMVFVARDALHVIDVVDREPRLAAEPFHLRQLAGFAFENLLRTDIDRDGVDDFIVIGGTPQVFRGVPHTEQ